MRTKLHAVLCCFAVILMLFRLVPIRADGYAYTVGEVQSLIDGIVAYKLQTTGSGSVQDWISGEIASGAGASSDWYAMALSQDGDYDFSGYRAALESAVAAGGSASATTREKNALALCACGST
ncbi:MAG: surface/cell-adhesion protein, partial [Oscillospiraceae bacterium]|nr:surface/cell-adhesion protein [Oscillospiraceae bacterium]